MAKKIKKLSQPKQNVPVESGMVRIYNRSKQMIPIQAKPPGGDFFLHEQQLRIRPGKSVLVPKSYLLSHQIENLCKSRHLQIIYDSEQEKG